MAEKNGSVIDPEENGSVINFPSMLIMMLLLAGWAVTLVVRLPTVVIHGDARWIGEHVWAGIPVLLAVILFIVFVALRWQTRHERKYKRVHDKRLRAEGKHPTQIRKQQKRDQKQQVAELKKQVAELEKQAAELEKQDKVQAKKSVLEKIQNEEELLRQARLQQQALARA